MPLFTVLIPPGQDEGNPGAASGGSVVKKQPASVGDGASIPGSG